MQRYKACFGDFETFEVKMKRIRHVTYLQALDADAFDQQSSRLLPFYKERCMFGDKVCYFWNKRQHRQQSPKNHRRAQRLYDTEVSRKLPAEYE